MSYIPKVNDYVQWKKLSGWVYFICDDYITIEIAVKNKPDNHVFFHKKTHCLVLCYRSDWKNLKYIKSRKMKHDESLQKNIISSNNISE